MTYSIRRIENGTYYHDQIIDWLMENRSQKFPMLPPLDRDDMSQDFKQQFIDSEKGTFLIAQDQQQNLIGTIGMKAYDHRFKKVNYHAGAAVEVVKLFVKPAWRRIGLGIKLFGQLESIAQSKEIEHLYLHTHRFLPGAIAFWERNGFETIWEQEGSLQTIHLDKRLKQSLFIKNDENDTLLNLEK